MPKLFRRTPKSFFSASGKHEKHNYIFSPKASSCLKMLLSKRRMLFWQHWQSFSWKQSENCSSTLKITKKFLLLMKKKFVQKCSCEVMKISFKQFFRKFSAQKITTNQKPLNFVPEKLPKMYLWTRRIKFWQQCWKVFVKVNWVFAQSPKKKKRKKLFNVFSLKTSIWTRKNLLWKTCYFFPQKVN